MSKRYSSRFSFAAGGRGRLLPLVSMLWIGLAWCSPEARAEEPRLSSSVESLLGASGLELPSETALAPSPMGINPPRQVSEPAPLHLNAAVLGPVELEESELQSTAPRAPTAGAVETIRERYPNRQVKIEREVTQDTNGNYVNHGLWKMWDERGNLVAEGRYELGARTGRWTRWHRRGDSPLFGVLPFSQTQGAFVSQATFENDLLHGEWTIYDSNQKVLSRIAFAHGERHGPATLWLPGGQVLRQMNYSQGDLDGDVMELGKDGKLAKTGTYQQGRRLAQKTTPFKNSQNQRGAAPPAAQPQTDAVYLFAKLVAKTPDDFWEARFAEYEPVGKDERHGAWTTWYQNGQVQVQGQYRHDLPVGQFTWWHSNGQKYSEGEYVDGQQHGIWQWWHRNGQKWTEGEFRHGEQIGQWSSWSESGRLDQQATYSGSRVQESTATLDPEEPPQSSRRRK